MKLSERDVQRFWAKVDKSTPDECWNWLGTMQPNGYGAFAIDSINKGAHRVSFVVHGGSLAAGLVIRHLCNNPKCVNPAHLAQGTHKENQQDRYVAGTMCFGAKNPVSRINPNSAKIRQVLSAQKRGSKNPQAKLSDEQVASIRAEYAAGGVTQLQLAIKYNVQDPAICRILSGKRRGAA